MRHRPRRAFLGLTEVAGYFGNLRQGLEANGVACIFVDESPDRFRYRRPGLLSRLGRAIATAAARADQMGPSGMFWRLTLALLRGVRLALRVVLLLGAMATCDLFVFGAGDSFLHGRELRVLRLLGKQIVWVFTGSDHRPPYLNGRAVRAAEAGGELGFRRLAEETVRIRDRVRMVERHADVVVAHPASAQFHRRPFIQFLAVGVPFPTPLSSVRPDHAGTVIVHSPSDPVSKGTAQVRATVDALRGHGLAVEYRELVGRPHDEVLAALAAADLLVDEVYSDTPMGMLGSEAASVGTPTISGGYYAPWVSATLSPEAVPPSEFVEPEELGRALEALVRDPDGRRRLGDEARAFVTSRWQPKEVAARYLRLLSGETPDGWAVEPSAVQYVGGWGMSAAERRRGIRRLVEFAGPASLCLDDSPTLRDALLEDAKT